MDNLAKDLNAKEEAVPQKGLYKFFHGRAKSFYDLSQAKCVKDLEKKKPEFIVKSRMKMLNKRMTEEKDKDDEDEEFLEEEERDDEDEEFFEEKERDDEDEEFFKDNQAEKKIPFDAEEKEKDEGDEDFFKDNQAKKKI